MYSGGCIVQDMLEMKIFFLKDRFPCFSSRKMKKITQIILKPFLGREVK